MRTLVNRGFAWVPGLSSAAAPVDADDDRFSDEEILTVVRAGEAGLKLTALCQVTGITVDTYYAWKARYGGLSALQLRQLRVRARTRRRRLTMLVGAVVLTLVGNGAIMLTRSAFADAEPLLPPPAVAVTPPPVPSPGPVAFTPEPSANAPAATSGSLTTGTPDPPKPAQREPFADMLTGDPQALSVQVAAVPDLKQAQDALERLARAGYPAHVTTKVVNGKEMYRVRVGPLRSRQLAEEIAVRLKKDGYSTPWVTH